MLIHHSHRGQFHACPIVSELVKSDRLLAAFYAKAEDAPRWAEYFKVFAAVRNETEESIIAQAEAALAPFGFHRDSAEEGFRGGSMPGIFVSFRANDSAQAMIVQAASPECFAFSATNYDRGKIGLVDRAGAALRARFQATFGRNVQFYSDAKCRVAL